MIEPASHELLYREAAALLGQRRWEAAATAFRQTIAAEPRFSWSYHGLGDALAALERWEEAATAYEHAIALNPDVSWSHHHLGNCLTKLERWSLAVDAYERAIALDPDVAASYKHLGHAFTRLERWDLAATALDRATTLDPADAEAHHASGDVQATLGRWEAAAAAYGCSATLRPDFHPSHQNLGIALSQLRRWDEAIVALRRAAEIVPDGASAFDHLGIALSELQRWEEARAAFERATALDRGNARSHQCLGHVLSMLGRWEDAITAFTRASSLRPDAAESHHHCGVALLKLHRWEEAATALARAAELNPRDVWTYRALGDALTRLDRWEEAAAAYRRGEALNPEWSQADVGGDVAWIEHWVRASLSPSMAGDAAKLLFVFDTDYGELTTAMYMLIGQDLAGRATFLFPARLFVNNRDVLPGRTLPYRSLEDIIRAVDEAQPDVVLLSSAYLYSIHDLLSLQMLERLMRLLDERGCRVATTDPFLGLQSALGRTTAIDIDIPADAPDVLRGHKEAADGKLTTDLSHAYRLLRDRIHVYPSYPGAPGQPPVEEVRAVSFFNPALLEAPRPEAAAAAPAESVRGGARTWLFVLATQDYELQLIFNGRVAVLDRLAARIRQALEAGRHPIFIGPHDCVQGLIQRFDGTQAMTLMTFCPFARFAALSISAEYAFYWNLVSHSMFLRLFNRLPVFLLDRGHLARSVTGLDRRAVDWYYQGWSPIQIEDRQPLALATLEPLGRRYREVAGDIVRHFRRAPSPSAMVAGILHDLPVPVAGLRQVPAGRGDTP